MVQAWFSGMLLDYGFPTSSEIGCSINSVENGPRNFTAFQDLAKFMNGTAAAATSQPTESTTGNNGAGAISVSMTSVVAVIGAALLAFTV